MLKVRGEKQTAQIIIEYDGFKEHFENLDEVDASNYEYYMKPEDVERQKILEGYGYKFLRINRFTIGEDPVKTLDERIRRCLKEFDVERQAPTLIEENRKLQQSLSERESKLCSRCGGIKLLRDFFDQSLKNGKGGHGRVCLACKAGPKSTDSKVSRRRKKSKTGLISRADAIGKDSAGKVYLNCPYSEKNECKRLGGRWDPFKKKWYVPQGGDANSFKRWM